MSVRIKSQKGQATVEMVLLLSAMVAMSYFVLKNFKETTKPVYNFISGPWKTIGGMIESGSWAKRPDAISNHPNYFRRMYSQRGMDPH